MKKTISTTVLMMTVLFFFSTVSHAQQNVINFGSYGAMASLAEQERVLKEQNETAKKNENIATDIKVAYAAKGNLNVAETKDQVEK